MRIRTRLTVSPALENDDVDFVCAVGCFCLRVWGGTSFGLPLSILVPCFNAIVNRIARR
jgi:hypothetical protein